MCAVFQYGEIYNFPQAVFEKALDDEEMVQEDTEAGGDDESASEPEDDEQVRISYCIRGQRDLCSVSVNLLSASKNISVPGLMICCQRGIAHFRPATQQAGVPMQQLIDISC